MSDLLVIGLSHHTAPLDVRETLAIADSSVGDFCLQARKLCEEAMLVSTCNRVELYVALPSQLSAEDRDDRLSALSALLVRPRPAARNVLYQHQGAQALKHLLRVACSLDSLVVGESQILGQVKAAYRLATQAGTTGPTLHAALSRAFLTAKRVRTETPIGRAAASVASVAVHLAQQIFGELGKQPVLLIGAGKMAELCARHLKQAGADSLYIANRTRSRADDLALRLGGSAHDLSELEPLLTKAAVVISSTGAGAPLVTPELVSRVMRARRGRWLLLIDIAVPRDIDPHVAEQENVYLYDLDALSDVAAGNRQERSRAIGQAESILDEELRRYAERAVLDDLAPVIKALRVKAQAIAKAEAARVLPRLGALSERDRTLVAGLAESVVNKLLHEPLTNLKRAAAEAEGPDLAQALRRLFALQLSLEPEGDPALDEGSAHSTPVASGAETARPAAPISPDPGSP